MSFVISYIVSNASLSSLHVLVVSVQAELRECSVYFRAVRG